MADFRFSVEYAGAYAHNIARSVGNGECVAVLTYETDATQLKIVRFSASEIVRLRNGQTVAAFRNTKPARALESLYTEHSDTTAEMLKMLALPSPAFADVRTRYNRLYTLVYDDADALTA